MKVEINIPDQVAKLLPGDMSIRILESIAIEGYRRGELSPKLVGILIGIDNRWEVERFLAERGVELNYNKHLSDFHPSYSIRFIISDSKSLSQKGGSDNCSANLPS